MAELLIYARANPGRDLAYHRGDIVTIQDDGWGWTAMESKAEWINQGLDPADWSRAFVLLKIPGVAVNRIQSLIAHWDDVAGDLYRKRMRFLDVDATPAQIRNKIGSDYEITVTPTQIRNFIKRKSDGAVYDPGWDA